MAGEIAKTTAVMNQVHKPWKSGEVRRQRQEALTQFLAAEGEDETLWADLKESMAFDKGVNIDQLPDKMHEAFEGMKAFGYLEEYVECLVPWAS